MNRKNLILFVGIILVITFLTNCNKNELPNDEQEKNLTVTPTSKTITAEAGSFDIIISSNIDWTITSDQDWCTFSANSGSNDATITANYTENTETTQRTATITINGIDVNSVSVSVTQQGREAANNPSFATGVSNPFGIEETGGGITFVDIDNDNDMDAFTIDGYGTEFFENIGNLNNPNFTTSVLTPFGIDETAGSIVFVDIDDDNDLDAFTIDGYGTEFFENIGNLNNPNFTTSVSNPFGIDKTGAGITFVDIDNDNDMDVFTTDGYGTKFIENIGNSKNPNFEIIIATPFGINKAALNITFVDIDDDSDMDAFTIDGYGTMFFENTGNINNPSFTSGVATPFGIDDTAWGIIFVDIDDDNDMDAFTLDGYGTEFFENMNFK